MMNSQELPVSQIRTEKKQLHILLLSQSDSLFNTFNRFLAVHKLDHQLRNCKNIAEGASFEKFLRICDIILVDMYSKNSLKFAVEALELAPAQTFIAGLHEGGNEAYQGCDTPARFRLSGMVDTAQDMDGVWAALLGLWKMWSSPSMISRIEDVSMCDVLQMIAMSGKTKMININGFPADAESSQTATRGCMLLRKGILEMAWSSGNEGVEALFDLLSLSRGFLHVMNPVDEMTVKNIGQPLEGLLISYCVRLDERKKIKAANQQPVSKKINRSRSKMPSADKRCCAHAPVKQKYPIRTLTDIFTIDPSLYEIYDWWSSHIAGLKSGIHPKKADELPIRWMTERELQHLMLSPQDARFLFLICDKPILEMLLKISLKRFRSASRNQEVMPVIRLWRKDGTSLYLAINLTDRISSAFNRFPAIVWTNIQKLPGIVGSLGRFGHKVLILLTDDSQASIDFIKTHEFDFIGICRWVRLNSGQRNDFNNIILNILTILEKISGTCRE